MSPGRVDNHPGPIEDYVVYLEKKLEYYESLFASCSFNYHILQPASLTGVESCQLDDALRFDPRMTSPPKKLTQVYPTAPQTAKGPSQWQVEMQKLLLEIPCTASWEHRRRDLGLNSAEDMVHVLVTLLGATIPGRTLEPVDKYISGFSSSSVYSPTLLPAYQFALSTCQFRKHSELMANIFLLREVILASYCEVLVKNGESQSDVDAIMSLCVKEKSLERYRRGAVWVNRRISELYSCGWKDRASELFLIWIGGRSLAQYGRFADYSKSSSQQFLDCLKSEKYTSPLIDTPELIPLSIPCMIKIISGDTLNLEQICMRLGYETEVQDRFQDLLPRYMSYLAIPSVGQSSGNDPPSLEAGGFMSVDSMYTQCTNFPPPLSSTSDTSREIDQPANLDMEDSRNAPDWLPTPSWQSNWQRNGWDYGLADPFLSL
ncbi:hypothetical protein X797_002598 [Metarhizium robertsii]|uniref:Uncharacterized protein n=1 Tax=Metarhizium robertsii TaxID=568076 RepID=A0A0A1V5R4_9HYPO|nr:hypothetical protein X797_002598 [Metarhizium robertsii]